MLLICHGDINVAVPIRLAVMHTCIEEFCNIVLIIRGKREERDYDVEYSIIIIAPSLSFE